MSVINAELPTIKLRLHLPRLFAFRLWLVARLLIAIGWVAGSMVEVEVIGPSEDEPSL